MDATDIDAGVLKVTYAIPFAKADIPNTIKLLKK